MMTVACVLKSGGAFGVEYVERLREGVERWAPGTPFCCLSDVHEVATFGLADEWPGWWSKMSLFQPGLFLPDETILYLDLDTVVAGDLSDLLRYQGPRAVLRDFYKPDKMMGSGVMLFRGDEMRNIWDAFTLVPEAIMERYPYRMDHFLYRYLEKAERVQDLFPDQVVSWKAEARGRGEVPNGARLVCFHGKPRLADLHPDEWMAKLWRGEAT